MRNALLIVVLMLIMAAAVAYVVSWFWAEDEVDAAAALPWPDGLGTLAAVPGRYPPQQENEAARKLTALAASLTGDDAITIYVRQEVARGDLTIGEPPASADVSAIRDLLLRETIVWKRDLAPQHGAHLHKIQMYVSVSRALVADALRRARQHDVAAWDDLHAAWNLAKSLDGHPQLIVRVVAMAISRSINAVAWKMPLPVPAWFDEVTNRDFVRPLSETLQYQNWRRWKDQPFPLRTFSQRIERERTLMSDFAQARECEFNRPAETGDRSDPNGRIDIGWQRAFRYRAEREATANALRARAGQPIEKESQCSDGAWSFDGKTLRFAKPIALPERRDTSMPLTLRVHE